MGKKLIIITNSFPFGKGEASFIGQEIPYLLNNFHITIISRNSKDSLTTDLESNIKVLRYNTKKSILDILCGIGMCFSRAFLREMKDWGFSFSRIVSLVKFLCNAASFRNYLNRLNGIDSNTLMYCYWNDYSTYGAALYCQKKRIACISRIHGGDLYCLKENGYYRAYKSEMSNLLTELVFISQAGKEYFLSTYKPQSEGNLVVRYLGTINSHRLISKRSDDGTLRLLSLSNVNKGKRVHRISQALSLINDIPIEWVHIGAGNELNNVMEITRTLLCGKSNISYKFLGMLPNDEVKRYFLNHPIDALINVSVSEGLPVSMMEAASFGVVIIGTDVGGVGEIVTKNNGFLLDKDFSDIDLADTIRTLYFQDSSNIDRMRESSIDLWELQFNAEKNYSDFSNHLTRIIDEYSVENIL